MARPRRRADRVAPITIAFALALGGLAACDDANDGDDGENGSDPPDPSEPDEGEQTSVIPPQAEAPTACRTDADCVVVRRKLESCCEECGPVGAFNRRHREALQRWSDEHCKDTECHLDCPKPRFEHTAVCRDGTCELSKAPWASEKEKRGCEDDDDCVIRCSDYGKCCPPGCKCGFAYNAAFDEKADRWKDQHCDDVSCGKPYCPNRTRYEAVCRNELCIPRPVEEPSGE